jgi:type I restriction enzyme S subunit
MADEYVESGVPVLRGVNVNRGRFHDDDFVFIDESTADSLSKFESHPGDVLLVHKGTLGQIGLMPRKRKYSRYIMGNSMMRVRCDPAKLLPEYLYYWLSSADGQHYLFSRVSQVGVPQIQTPLSTLRQAALPVPPLSEQRAIANILGTLDDKIELNRRMNETLEAIARALFKSWFIDFDPVRAKAEGRDPGLPQRVADPFPDSFEDSDLGEIPKGWRVGPILDIARLLSGGTPKTDRDEYWSGSIPWASAKDVSQCNNAFLIETERMITARGLEESATQMIPALSSVVVARGATTGRMVVLGDAMAMNQTCYALATSVGTPFALYCHLRQEIGKLVHAAHGSVFDTITTSTFATSKVVLPPRSVLDMFEERGDTLFRRILAGTKASRTLAVLRDTLLPKLISGELRVKEAEQVAEIA